MKKIALLLAVLILTASSCSQPDAVEEAAATPAETAPAETEPAETEIPVCTSLP